MRIYIADLNYLYDWDRIWPLPLNAGYIAAYLLDAVPDATVEIFKDPARLLDRLAEASPDILALSHYEWNTNLDFAVLKKAKRIDPRVFTVMGGPNFHTDEPEWIESFFRQRPQLDLYIAGEGE